MRAVGMGLLLIMSLLAGCESAAPIGLWGQPGITSAEGCARAAATLERRLGGIHADPLAAADLDRITARLCAANPELPTPVQVRLLASPSLNAYSLPGPRVYLTWGLWKRMRHDDQVAAVIAHELAHVVAGDSLKPRCRDRQAALQCELDADHRAVQYLQQAGYDPSALVQILEEVKECQPAGWADARLVQIEALHRPAAFAAAPAGRFQ